MSDETELEETTVVDMPATEDEPTADQMGRVRELLFGKKTRQIDNRLVDLEAKLFQEHRLLREEVNERFQALEVFLKAELKALLEAALSEEEKRKEQGDTLTHKLTSVQAMLDEQTSKLEKRLEASDRDHRQALLEARQKLSDDMRRRSEELDAKLAFTTETLTAGKTDRATMANLLNEMALRLAAEED